MKGAFFFQYLESIYCTLVDLFIIIISDIRKIPAKPLPFLNLRSIIPVMLKEVLDHSFCGMDL